MREQTIEAKNHIPFTMMWAEPTNSLLEVTGHYDSKTQQWSDMDIQSTTTWSRSSTTGVFTDDPDEDKDD